MASTARSDRPTPTYTGPISEARAAQLKAANINPRTGLATDYLNHFNEAIMVLELIPSMPACTEDLMEWNVTTYREHFLATAAQMMRRVLIDHAREHLAAKRPGAHLKVLLDDRIGAAQPRECELMMVDEALGELTRLDPRQGQIVELRYFGGLSEQEVAVVLSISRATVTREWQTARAWLYRRLTTGRARGAS